MIAAKAVDLFAGPGGWDLAARALGLEVLGVEYDDAACRTRAAAGLLTLRADVAALDPREFGAPVLIGSPPCPSFSRAGKQMGRHDVPLIVEAMLRMAALSDDPRREVEWHDERSALTLEPLRWALATSPRVIALEQVPAVLPLWDCMAVILRERGYSVWTGRLRAEMFGVPQTRERAFLIASLEGEVGAPAATHSRYHERDPGRLDLGVLPWVSMADALGWGAGERVGFPRLNDRDDGGKYRARDLRPADQPAFGLTEKVRSWQRFDGEEPGERVTVDEAAALQTFPWAARRPATTVQGDPRLWPPGHKENRHDPPGKYQQRRGATAYRMEAWEGACLQSFPDGYPWQGTKTKQFEQIGNAVPPLLARAVLEEALAVERAVAA